MTEEAIAYGKKNPFPAPVKTILNLNGRGSAKLTCHVELSIEGSGMEYVPGDILGVFPRNCPEVVDDFISAAGFSGEEHVAFDDKDGSVPLREALESRFDITGLTASTMKKYALLANNSALEECLAPERKESLKDWLWGREFRDLLIEFPPDQHLSVKQLTEILRKMPPRLYSIASSFTAHPGEVHLTVGAVTYETMGLLRKGVCSTFLCERIKAGDKVDVYTHHNKNFFLPDDGDVPIIMIGPGTGIAPFRAFVEERAALGHKGKNWLFFGDQHFASDFLYQSEWQAFMKKGVLDRMDVAFSRDQAFKVYVQDRLMERADDVYAWLQEGAFFYVCGDANRMAKDVHQTLINIFAGKENLSSEDAEEKVKALQKSKRYQRDVY